MIIFNGWKSLLAPLLLAGALALLPNAGGTILGGVLVGAYGLYINRWRETPTGRVKSKNGFFWVPLQYWGLVIAVLGVVSLIALALASSTSIPLD